LKEENNKSCFSLIWDSPNTYPERFRENHGEYWHFA
jgi:hypothetical protein